MVNFISAIANWDQVKQYKTIFNLKVELNFIQHNPIESAFVLRASYKINRQEHEK